ncbi:MAG: hypothetical protein ACFNTB_06690 [Prevotella denticola]
MLYLLQNKHHAKGFGPSVCPVEWEVGNVDRGRQVMTIWDEDRRRWLA